MVRKLAILAVVFLSGAIAWGEDNLIRGGDFEQGLSAWAQPWSREPSIRATLDTEVKHGGRQAVRIEHTGKRDWSLAQATPLKVVPGQIYELTGWVRLEGEGNATLGVTLRDAGDQAIEWIFAGRTTRKTADWKQLRSRFVIPPGTASILPRLTGEGPSKVWFDDAVLTSQGTIDSLRMPGLPPEITCANGQVEVTFHTAGGHLTVHDLRSKRTWQQRASSASDRPRREKDRGRHPSDPARPDCRAPGGPGTGSGARGRRAGATAVVDGGTHRTPVVPSGAGKRERHVSDSAGQRGNQLPGG